MAPALSRSHDAKARAFVSVAIAILSIPLTFGDRKTIRRSGLSANCRAGPYEKIPIDAAIG
jgi:hypothetical protein